MERVLTPAAAQNQQGFETLKTNEKQSFSVNPPADKE
jgi:hypothetical protein